MCPCCPEILLKRFKTSLKIHPRTRPQTLFNLFPFRSKNRRTFRSSRLPLKKHFFFFSTFEFNCAIKVQKVLFTPFDICLNHLSLLVYSCRDRDHSSVFCVSLSKPKEIVLHHPCTCDANWSWNWRVAHSRKQIDAHHLYYRNEGLLHILICCWLDEQRD